VLFEKEIIMKSNDLTLSTVDTLGELLAQIAELTKKADAIKDNIKDTASAGGPKVVEGDFFKATYMKPIAKLQTGKRLQKFTTSLTK